MWVFRDRYGSKCKMSKTPMRTSLFGDHLLSWGMRLVGKTSRLFYSLTSNISGISDQARGSEQWRK